MCSFLSSSRASASVRTRSAFFVFSACLLFLCISQYAWAGSANSPLNLNNTGHPTKSNNSTIITIKPIYSFAPDIRWPTSDENQQMSELEAKIMALSKEYDDKKNKIGVYHTFTERNQALRLIEEEACSKKVALIRAMVKLSQETYGPEHPVTSFYIYRLAQEQDSSLISSVEDDLTSFDLGNDRRRDLKKKLIGLYAAKEGLYHQVLAIDERVLGDVHPQTVFALYGLIEDLEWQERYSDALPLCQRAMAATSQDSKNVFSSQRNKILIECSYVFEAQGLYLEADHALSEAVERATAAERYVGASDGMDRDPSIINGRLLVILLKESEYYYERHDRTREKAIEVRIQKLNKSLPKTGMELGYYMKLGLEESRRELIERAPVRKKPDLECLAKLVPEWRDDQIHFYQTGHKNDAAISSDIGVVPQIREPSKKEKEELNSLFVDKIVPCGNDPTKCDEANVAAQRTLALVKETYGPTHPEFVKNLISYGMYVFEMRDHYEEAEKIYRQALAINPDDLGALRRLAMLLDEEGRYTEAEPLYRHVFSSDLKQNPFGLALHDLTQLAENIRNQGGRDIESQKLLSCEDHYFKWSYGPDYIDSTGYIISARLELANTLMKIGKYADAEVLLREIISRMEARYGPTIDFNLLKMWDSTVVHHKLAISIMHQLRYGEAEEFLRQILATKDARYEGALGYDREVVKDLAEVLSKQGKYDEAKILLQYVILQDEGGASLPTWIDDDRRQLGLVLLNSKKDVSGAVSEFRQACSSATNRFEGNIRGNANDDVTSGLRTTVALCNWGYVSALQNWVSQGGGHGNHEDIQSLTSEMFIAAQRVQHSQSSDALNSAAARKLTGGRAEIVVHYEELMKKRAKIDLDVSNLIKDENNKSQVVSLLFDRGKIDDEIKKAEGQLGKEAPEYWDLRVPQPVTLEELVSARNLLLKPDEALIFWLIPPDHQDRGIVFAVSNNKLAAAAIPMTGVTLSERISRLREQIDPCGYGTKKTDCTRTTIGFDRTASFELYQALLGAPAIQDIIKPAAIRTLLIVPTGVLTSLPPSLLVTTKPEGDSSEDQTYDAMRYRTEWLIKRKAIALLPSVSSLRTLRFILPRSQSLAKNSNSSPLFMMADPDFSGDGRKPPMDCQTRSIPRSIARYFNNGGALRDQLAGLCPLPGTRREASALKELLHADDHSILMGREAREAKLREASDKQLLSGAEVVAFATHGLVAGDLGVGEPALVLAAPLSNEPGDDGLLTASKAAGLHLNAQWVLLSACNTASPDAADAEGFSGLMRAFFFAGAKSLLVSHWRVGDDAATALTTKTLSLQQSNAQLNKAEALRQAMLSVMDGDGAPDEDAKNNFAFPASWAPFVFVGVPQ